MSMVKLQPNKASKCSDYERAAKTYLAVGTGITSVAGEDVLSTGRLALFEISDPISRQGESDVALGPALPPPKVSGWGVYCCDFLLLPITSYYFLLFLASCLC